MFYIECESEICNFGVLQKLIDWFTENGMRTNPSKLQIMFLGRKVKNKLCLNMKGLLIQPRENVQLLGVHIGNLNSKSR